MDPISAAIVTVLGKYALDKGAELAKEVGPTAKGYADQLFKLVMDRLRSKPAGEVIAEEFKKDPATYQKPVEKQVDEVVSEDDEFAQRAKELIAKYDEAAAQYAQAHNTKYVRLGDRAVYTEGNVGGDIITGDNVARGQ